MFSDTAQSICPGEHAGDEVKTDRKDAEHRRDQNEALDTDVRVRDEGRRREIGKDRQSDPDRPNPRRKSRVSQSVRGARRLYALRLAPLPLGLRRRNGAPARAEQASCAELAARRDDKDDDEDNKGKPV
jgi:hypothetical protein